MKKYFLKSFIALLIMGLMVVSTSQANDYKLTILGHLGGNISKAEDINENGQIVGSSLIEAGHPYYNAFLWENNVMTDLGTLPEDNTSGARSINNNGLIVGISGAEGRYDACLWVNGIPTALGIYGWAEDINNNGQIVGGDLTWVHNDQAWLWDDGSITYLGTMGEGQVSVATSINNLGQVVGYAHVTTPDTTILYDAFIWEDGEMKRLDNVPEPNPSAHNTRAYAINDQGQVVGYASGSNFLWYEGNVTWLPEEIIVARDINNKSQIVGQAQFFTGEDYETRACLYDSTNGLQDLNDFIPSDSTWILQNANAISDGGQIVGSAVGDGERGFLLTPIPTIDDIIDFIKQGVNAGTIEGCGRKPWLANVKLWLFRQMLESAKWLLEHDKTNGACTLLNRIEIRCDEDPRPPDFIQGEAVPELADMTSELMCSLECKGCPIKYTAIISYYKEGEGEEEKSWIEIQLVDKAGNPMAHEKYELYLPDGSVIEGELDENGIASASGVEPGTADITFPDLDPDSWKRI
jgi:probable HAF family extracellular repeat protein